MPRPGPRRLNVVVRMLDGTRADIERRALGEGITTSEWVRRAVAYALDHMPPGWTP